MTENLLCVDWDYFFPNPMTNVEDTTDVAFFDWGHAEAPLFIDVLWATRAATFFAADRPLPDVNDEWMTFWDRFTIADDAPVYVSDSNLYAGLVGPETDDTWNSVSLYDAHHDSLYNRSYEEFLAAGTVSCEDWMAAHYMHGTRDLRVRYPRWKTNWADAEPQPGIPVDRAMDDGENPGLEFHAIHICRSGAWVPPWCDEKFHKFHESAPGGDITQMDDVPLLREFDMDAARAFGAQQRAMMQSRAPRPS